MKPPSTSVFRFSCCQHYPDFTCCGMDVRSSFEERCAYPEALAIDFLAMSDAEDQHDQAVVFDLADKPVITNAVFPELPKS
jgi:hypothetical protein